MCRYSDIFLKFLIKISCLMWGVIVQYLVVPIQPRLSLQTSPFSEASRPWYIILYHYFRLMYARTPIFTASASFLDKCTTTFRLYPKTKPLIICNENRRKIGVLKFFLQKIRQIVRKFALLSLNVNKLSRFFCQKNSSIWRELKCK